jgi:release factor glutamine methyltransferase
MIEVVGERERLSPDPDELVARLRAAGCVFAEDEARLLRASGAPDLEALVQRRVHGEPLEYVLGWAEFCGLRVAVAPGVFVPRGRSALLVAQAVARARRGSVVVDLCCGAGAVGLAIASAVGGVDLHAVDIDAAAVACARRNLAGIGTVHEGDLYAGLPERLRGRVGLLVANAPYVPSASIELMPREARDYEARVALDGGSDGLAVQRRIAASAPSWLTPDGQLLIETSGRQADATAQAFADSGFVAEIVRDDDADATVVVGTLRGRPVA